MKPWYKIATPWEDLRAGKPLDARKFVAGQVLKPKLLPYLTWLLSLAEMNMAQKMKSWKRHYKNSSCWNSYMDFDTDELKISKKGVRELIEKTTFARRGLRLFKLGTKNLS
jgi:hypothetical protein